MNLAGRRIQQDFVDNRIPRLLESINASCPDNDIIVTIDWDSFEDDQPALENLWVVFEQPAQAIEAVCQDNLGRQAIAERIHALVIRNVGSTDQISAVVDDGTLTVQMRCADAQAGTPGYTEIERVLTAYL